VASLLEKFKGTLVGCAVGDALGMPLEGMDAAAIRAEHGRVTDFLDSRFGAGMLTDDTQMTITLAQSIIELGKFDEGHASFKFGVWIDLSDRGVKEARGVGKASSEASRLLHSGAGADESGQDSAGCGAAMRAAPIGLRYYFNMDALYRSATAQARLTHTDPRAIAGSAAVAYGVARGINDEGDLDPGQLAMDVGSFVADPSPAMSAKLSGLADYLDATPEEGFAYTGTGAAAIETVPAAFFAFLRTPGDLEETVVTAANAGGDTDSIAALAGAISGSFNGLGAIPDRWKNKVEGGAYIESVAYRLFTLTPAYKPKARPLV
jgi:ADP-ribosyl-[dinitrogen reductase] hydrolase